MMIHDLKLCEALMIHQLVVYYQIDLDLDSLGHLHQQTEILWREEIYPCLSIPNSNVESAVHFPPFL